MAAQLSLHLRLPPPSPAPEIRYPPGGRRWASPAPRLRHCDRGRAVMSRARCAPVGKEETQLAETPPAEASPEDLECVRRIEGVKSALSFSVVKCSSCNVFFMNSLLGICRYWMFFRKTETCFSARYIVCFLNFSVVCD